MSYLDRSGLERYHAGVKSKIKNLRDIIAEEYDSTAVYTVGDLCVYEGGLYVCTTAIPTAEAWTAAHWAAVTVGEEISDLKSELSDLSESVSGKYTKPASGIPASDLASGVIPDVSGFYTKPSGGIPSSDFSSGVQTSLGKADTAYQKPSGGIPLTDLASNVQNVSGTTPSITGVSGMRYICGEVSTLSITPPASGCIDVLFESGSTATVLTVPNTVKFPSWFDSTTLEPSCFYEINILDGIYGAVMKWT